MKQLEALVAEAEVSRQMQICNACRYCETYCAVFPAMTRRLSFNDADAHYLANLCHSCGACLHACQYAPPHEFAVNVPRAMAQVRARTYEHYAWPAPLGALYRRNGLAVAMATALGLVGMLLLAVTLRGPSPWPAGGASFYAVFSHNLMVVIFGSVALWVVLALGIGATRFWRGQSPGAVSGEAAGEAVHDALSLKFLGGGHGDGCNEESDRFTLLRRRFHHFTFYGFMLCFAATSVATLYHYVLGLHAPYPPWSLPVVLGTVGGVGLLIGPAGLLWLNLRRDPLHGDPAQRPMDRGFIALLLASSATGLALLALRETAAMPWWLAIHLGFVLALFALLPYGKFAHVVYRCAALLKYQVERRQPGTLRMGAD